MNFIYLILSLSVVISQNDKSDKNDSQDKREKKGGVQHHTTTDYCKINENHILCKAIYPKPTKKVSFATPRTDTERALILNQINQLRNEVAGGTYLRKGQTYPEAANMFELTWNKDFERAAFNGIKNCDYSETFRNCCNCMNTGKTDLHITRVYRRIEDYVGTNITIILQDMIETEKNNGTPYKIACIKNNTMECIDQDSFIANLLNDRKVQIACVYVQCNITGGDDTKTDTYLVCVTNLDKKLDILNQPLYEMGTPLSMCPNGTYQAKNYTNLCHCPKVPKCLIKPAPLKSNCTKRSDSSGKLQPGKSTSEDKNSTPGTIAPPPPPPVTAVTKATTAITTTTKKTGEGNGSTDINGGLFLAGSKNIVFSFILTAAVIIN